MAAAARYSCCYRLAQIDGGLPLHAEGAVRYSPYLPDSGPADAAGPTSSRTVTCVAIEDEVRLITS